MGRFNDTLIRGRGRGTLAPVDDDEFIRLGEAKAIFLQLFQGPWDAGVNYLAGQMANDGGTIYIANEDNINEQPSANIGGSWRVGLAGSSAGSNGNSAYVYIAYASASDGTGFTTTFNASLDYIAVITTTSVISSPQASNFSGKWKNYKGATGAAGSAGSAGASAFIYIAYASDASGTGFTTTFNANLNFIAIKSTTTAIGSPAASDFTGLWKQYGGGSGVAGVTAPITNTSGTIGINAASANTASYVVQRDSSGNFAAGKIVLSASAPASDHLTLAGATLGYTSGNEFLFSAQAAVPTLRIGVSQILQEVTISSVKNLQAIDTANSNAVAFSASNGVMTITSLKLTGLNGILKASSGAVTGSATTADLTENTNLYYTDTRVRGCVLTGFSGSTGGTVVATDTILAGLGRLENRTALNDAKVTGSDRALKAGDTFTGQVVFAPGVGATAQPIQLITAPAYTAQLSAETIDVNWNLARTLTISASSLSNWRSVLIQPPTLSGNGSAAVISTAATVTINGCPKLTGGSALAIASSVGLRITSVALNNGVGTGMALWASAPGSANTNLSALFDGQVTINPSGGNTTLLDVGQLVQVRNDGFYLKWPDATWHKISLTNSDGEYLWDVAQAAS